MLCCSSVVGALYVMRASNGTFVPEGSLSAQRAQRAPSTMLAWSLSSEVRYWHEQEHRDGIGRRSHVVVVIRALLDKTGNLQTSSAPCSFCKTDGC